MRGRELVGVVDGDTVYAWCGHRWNAHGSTGAEVEHRIAHCSLCADAGVSHAIRAAHVSPALTSAVRAAWRERRRPRFTIAGVPYRTTAA